jgi:hypothetical protein
VPDLVAALVAMGVRVHEVVSGRDSLEQRFLELVGRGPRDGDTSPVRPGRPDDRAGGGADGGATA